MPLRDHFDLPIRRLHSWEGFHALWPGMIVQALTEKLPEGYLAEPRARLGSYYEVDIGAYETDLSSSPAQPRPNGSSSKQTSILLAPTLSFETDLADAYEYEVLFFDVQEEKRLVAAIEFVSPGNKDRPEHRQAFVAKCLALLQQGICVSMVDIVTNRHFNLYSEMLGKLGQTDPKLSDPPANIYSVTCRTRPPGQSHLFDSWAYRLAVGEPLPTLPIWLAEDHMLNFDLEASYEATCRALRIPAQ